MSDLGKPPIDTGGPAFPEGASGPYPNGEIVLGRTGMTLRDWVAGMASEADVEAHEGGQIHPQSGRKFNTRSREQAKYAYADAMIAVRKGDAQ